MSKKKKIIIGWTVRKQELKFRRDSYGGNDGCKICISRGNPNPTNYTKSNNWKKVRITIEEL